MGFFFQVPGQAKKKLRVSFDANESLLTAGSQYLTNPNLLLLMLNNSANKNKVNYFKYKLAKVLNYYYHCNRNILGQKDSLPNILPLTKLELIIMTFCDST